MKRLIISQSTVIVFENEYFYFEFPIILNTNENKATLIIQSIIEKLMDLGFKSVKATPLSQIAFKDDKRNFLLTQLTVSNPFDSIKIDLNLTYKPNYLPEIWYKKMILSGRKTQKKSGFTEGYKTIIIKLQIPNVNFQKLKFLEHTKFKKIPGTTFQIRIDKSNTQTKVQKHAHIFDSKGNQVISVNFDGTKHDSLPDYLLPQKVSDYLRAQGFNIKSSNLVEGVSSQQPINEILYFKSIIRAIEKNLDYY